MTTNALSLLGDILPEGGIAALKHDDFIFDSNTPEVLARLGVDSKKTLMSAFLALHTLESALAAKEALTVGMKQGLIGKDDLIDLFCAQSPDKRSDRPLITLENIWEICCHARVSEKDESLISKEEVIALAERFISIHPSDMRMFMMQWFYRNEGKTFSENFLLHWYNNSGTVHGGSLDGKCASLVAIALHAANPTLVTLDGITERLTHLARRSPHDHGIHRYLFLAMYIAGENNELRARVVDKWVVATISQIDSGTSGEYQSEFAISMFMGSSDLTIAEKHRAIMKLHAHIDERVASLRSLVARALKN